MLSSTLNLVLGLSYVFLVLSLIVTSLTELLASWRKWRAADLEKGILSLLRDPSLAKQFFEHPLIQDQSYASTVQGKPGATSSSGPSYIASTDFAAVVYNDICGAGRIAVQTPEQLKALLETVPDEQLKKTLKTLAATVDYKVEDFKTELENWYDRSMDRVSGWYKRRMQAVTLWVGLFVVIALNANAVDIAQRIAHDSSLRDSLASHAQNAVDSGTPSAGQEASPTELSDADEVIGWKSSPLSKIDWKKDTALGSFFWILASNVPGWCLTAVAVSLGAPFWFDMLKQIIAIRGAGKVPPSSNDPETTSN